MPVSDSATRITIRIGAEEKEILWEYAQENDLTISQVIRRAIKEFIAHEWLS